MEKNPPALTTHTWLRYANFIVLYAAQGVPEGMTYFGIPAWMAMQGKSAMEVGSFLAIVGIPWSFKILVAPLMDRFMYLPMGRRRPWVLFGQLGLMASFIGMAMVPDPLNHLGLLSMAGFFVSFFGAFQDVAVDGMAIDVVPVDQQARANGFMWGSKVVATALSMVTGIWIINRYGFRAAILLLSVTVCLIMLAPLLTRERPGERLLPWSRGAASPEVVGLKMESWKAIFKSLFSVFRLPSSLYMAVAFFVANISFGLMDAVFPVFAIQVAGWTDEGFSHVYSISTIAAGIGGMLIGGAMADKLGARQVMSIYLIGFIILGTVMYLLKPHWQTPGVVASFMWVHYALYTFFTVASFATGMQLCWKRIAATQFTLYMAISNLGRAFGSGLIGPMRERMGWEYVLLSLAGFAFVTLLTIQLIRLVRHSKKVELLEINFNRAVIDRLVVG